jgi:tRNA(adenine34) deaminase
VNTRAFTADDEIYMRHALELARQASAQGEVPVGAVLVIDGQMRGEGFNKPANSLDPTAHAEIVALRMAAERERNYRLPDSTLFVTLEPCVMCAGALVTARVARLVFAARDLRFGGVRSKFRLADSELLNHSVHVEEGLLGTDAAELLSEFFRSRRTQPDVDEL